jgi:hypothetical protein
MSAFVCSDLHISIIASAIASDLNLPDQTVADYLKAINIESVNYRYTEQTRKSKCKLQNPVIQYNQNDIANLIDSYIYQACEKDTIQFHAISALLNQWKKDNNANPELSSVWSI